MTKQMIIHQVRRGCVFRAAPAAQSAELRASTCNLGLLFPAGGQCPNCKADLKASVQRSAKIPNRYSVSVVVSRTNMGQRSDPWWR